MMCYQGVISLAAVFLINFYAVESTVFLIDIYTSKMVELPGNNQPCRVHHDRTIMENTLNKVDPKYIQRVNTDLLNEVSDTCNNLIRMNKTGEYSLIFPGTKWCGSGNIATGYNDLGKHAKEDRCCRDHDHCPIQLEPGQCRHGICNTSPFTRSHCDCDETFKKCLRDVGTNIASIIGTIYFNIAQGACIKERRFCPQAMRNNLSYSWFCEEWKFMPFEFFMPSPVVEPNQNLQVNEITGKLQEPSKINEDLGKIFGDDEDVAKILSEP